LLVLARRRHFDLRLDDGFRRLARSNGFALADLRLAVVVPGAAEALEPELDGGGIRQSQGDLKAAVRDDRATGGSAAVELEIPGERHLCPHALPALEGGNRRRLHRCGRGGFGQRGGRRLRGRRGRFCRSRWRSGRGRGDGPVFFGNAFAIPAGGKARGGERHEGEEQHGQGPAEACTGKSLVRRAHPIPPAAWDAAPVLDPAEERRLCPDLILAARTCGLAPGKANGRPERSLRAAVASLRGARRALDG